MMIATRSPAGHDGLRDAHRRRSHWPTRHYGKSLAACDDRPEERNVTLETRVLIGHPTVGRAR